MSHTHITVLTATLNAEKTIQKLGKDLLAQTDNFFTWLIIDGGSTDKTLKLIPQELGDRVQILSEPDFGIYDALNKGIKNLDTEYYLVVGADDRLHADAIKKYRQLAQNTHADLIAASVIEAGRIIPPNMGQSWLRGHKAYIAQHSVGVLIKKTLHETYGYYSRYFPIAADQLFIKSAVQRACTIHYAPEFIAGEFTCAGLSSSHYLACLFEFTLVQIKTENHAALQLLLMFLRIIRHWKKVAG